MPKETFFFVHPILYQAIWTCSTKAMVVIYTQTHKLKVLALMLMLKPSKILIR